MGMMGMLMFLKVFWLVSFIFTVLLLAASFFVLFVARKTETQGLKIFGYVIAVLLWVCAAVVFSAVISLSLAGRNLHMPISRVRPPMMQQEPSGMMQGSQMQGEEMMKGKMEGPKKIR